jgi:uncharacterized membrane protein
MPVSDAHWRHPEFRRGAREMIGIALGIAAWGLVTGVAMINSGIGLPLALMMSLLVFAGSAQLATVALIASGAPLWVVWATAICVNLRFVIFSASGGPISHVYPLAQRARLSYFTADLNYVLFMRRFPQPRPAPGTAAVFLGRRDRQLVPGSVLDRRHLAGEACPALGHRLSPARWRCSGMTCTLLTDRGHLDRLPPGHGRPRRGRICAAAEAEHRGGHRRRSGHGSAHRPQPALRRSRRWTTRPAAQAILAIVGLAAITLLTRGFFILPDREMPLPGWLRQGLRYAPLAALAAVVAPEIVMTQGQLIARWRTHACSPARPARPGSSGAAASWAPSSPACGAAGAAPRPGVVSGLRKYRPTPDWTSP